MKCMLNRLLAYGLTLLPALAGSNAVHAETRALLAGVSHFHSAQIPDLAGPANDLSAMELLMRSEGAQDVTTLSDDQVSRANMEDAIYKLGKRAKPGDWIVFYYTGHGAQAVTAIKGTRDGDFDQFVPLAGFDPAAPDPQRYIVDKDFYDWFAGYVPRDVNILMIADTCHSGSLNRSADKRVRRATSRLALADWASDMRLTARPGLQFDRILATGQLAFPANREDLPNLIYIGAAQDGQFALEMPLPVEGRPPRGLLTFAIEQGLSQSGADGKTMLADLDADGRITAGEIAIYLDSQVRALSDQQQQPRTAFTSGREDTTLFANSSIRAPQSVDWPRPQIYATSAAGSEKLRSLDQPWLVVGPDDGADFIWDYDAGELLRRSGDLVAQNVLDTAAVRGVIEKWNSVGNLLPLINEARAKLQVMPGGADIAYRPGDIVAVNLTAKSSGNYVTVFNLASDGTVQSLYPTEAADGDGLMSGKALDGIIQTRVVRPFGVDHVIAVTSPAPQNELRALLRSVDGQRASGRTVPAIKRILANAPGRAGLSIVEIFTQR